MMAVHASGGAAAHTGRSDAALVCICEEVSQNRFDHSFLFCLASVECAAEPQRGVQSDRLHRAKCGAESVLKR